MIIGNKKEVKLNSKILESPYLPQQIKLIFYYLQFTLKLLLERNVGVNKINYR